MKNRNYSFLWLLLTGIVVWLVPVLVRIVLAYTGHDIMGQDALSDMFIGRRNRTAIVFGVLLVGVIIPIFEEFLFRYWHRCDKRVFTSILFLSMGCYVSVCSFWWLGIVGFLLCFLIDRLFANRQGLRTLALVFTTSVLFALAHVNGFSSMGIDMVLCMVSLFGFGLVANWLVLNVGFLWACLLHILNNTIAILFIVMMPEPPLYDAVAMHFDTPLYSASLQPLAEESIDFREVDDNTVTIKGSLPIIAFNLVKHFNPDVVFGSYSQTELFRIVLSDKTKEPYWSYTLTFHDSIPYRNAPWLANDLMAHSRLQIDTTYENMYVIGVEDMQRLCSSSGETSSTLVGLAEELRIVYDCPVVLEKGTNEYLPVKYDSDLLSYEYDIEEISSELSSRLGLFLYKSSVHKIQVITFSDK